MFGNKTKKLCLSKETVRALSGQEMHGVVGGAFFGNVACTTGVCTCTCNCGGQYAAAFIITPKVRF